MRLAKFLRQFEPRRLYFSGMPRGNVVAVVDPGGGRAMLTLNH